MHRDNHPSMRRATARNGFTIAEGLIASAVLATAVVAICAAVMAGHSQGTYTEHADRALKLAEELAEYIAVMPYNDPQGASTPGPDSGESGISAFDNADDFHGYSEAAGAIRDVAGNLYPAAYQVFSRSVTAVYTTQTVAQLGGTINGLRVTVTVTDAQGQTWTLTRFIAQPS